MPQFSYPGIYVEELPGVFHPISGLSPSTAGPAGLADSLGRPQGVLIWGARTSSQDTGWQYVNVKRLTVYIEQSLSQGVRWAVFENNGPTLWAQVVQSVEGFLTRQWLSGSLQGNKKDEAYFVQCNSTTMTQNDLDNGRLVIVVGFAPVQPAEFVVIRITIQTKKK